MAIGIERWKMQLRGGRGRARSVLLVLHGAPTDEIRRLHRWAGRLSSRHAVVAVDGGYDRCLAAGVAVDRFVGDGDSVLSALSSIPVERYDTDKDYSDLAGALRLIRPAGADVVLVAGLLGGRVDHEWANLGELTRATRDHRAVVAAGERAGIVLTRHGLRLGTSAGTTFSLFAAGANATVTLKGARWKLMHERLRRPSHGLSNVTTGTLDLTVHSGAVRLVFPRGE